MTKAERLPAIRLGTPSKVPEPTRSKLIGGIAPQLSIHVWSALQCRRPESYRRPPKQQRQTIVSGVKIGSSWKPRDLQRGHIVAIWRIQFTSLVRFSSKSPKFSTMLRQACLPICLSIFVDGEGTSKHRAKLLKASLNNHQTSCGLEHSTSNKELESISSKSICWS